MSGSNRWFREILLIGGAALLLGCQHKMASALPQHPAPSPSTAATAASIPSKEVHDSFAVPPLGPGTEAAAAGPDRLHRVYFAFDRYELSEDDRGRLQQNAKWLEAHPRDRILIAGNCDERGTERYNVALGEERARSAREYLQSLGIDASRIDIISYGKERPLDPGHDEDAWAKNRRDDFTTIVQR